MNTKKRLSALAAITTMGLGTLTFTGCGSKQEKKVEAEPEYVTVCNPHEEMRTSSQSGIGVALGDIDGDGLSDLVVGSPSSIKYFRNIGDGRFREEQNIYNPHEEMRTSSQSGIGVALGDIDGDKDLDLIVGSPSAVGAYINTSGKFIQQVR